MITRITDSRITDYSGPAPIEIHPHHQDHHHTPPPPPPGSSSSLSMQAQGARARSPRLWRPRHVSLQHPWGAADLVEPTPRDSGLWTWLTGLSPRGLYPTGEASERHSWCWHGLFLKSLASGISSSVLASTRWCPLKTLESRRRESPRKGA